MSESMFHQSTRIGNDTTDYSQRTLQNTQYLTNVFSLYSHDATPSHYLDFATQHPGMMAGANHGQGLSAFGAEKETELYWSMNFPRSLEKLQLFPRPFATIPYLGRGSCNSVLESQLLQGESIRGKKSSVTVMEKPFLALDEYPLEEGKRAHLSNSTSIEETALNGWVRGGTASRELEENYFSKKSKPTDSSY